MSKRRQQHLEQVDTETGEVIVLQQGFDQEYDHIPDLIARYDLQDQIKSILPWSFSKKGKSSKHRVKNCLSGVRGEDSGEGKKVELHKSIESGRSTFKNLFVCGSVWECPLCAAKISERRAALIQHISDQHKEAKGGMVLLTLTFSHKKWDDVKELAEKLTKAFSSFAIDRSVKSIFDDWGVVGGVRSLEVTWSEVNGFHPHIHVLLYTKSYVDVPRRIEKNGKWFDNPKFEGSPLDRLEKALFPRWYAYCLKRGLGEPNEKHGVRCDNGDFASEYVAKFGDWNSAKEITKANLKKGKKDSYSPFELAALSKVQDQGTWEGPDFAGLFRQYTEAFHGKQATTWYLLKNLKDHYDFEGLEDVKDQELAEAELEDLVLVGELSIFQWWRVVQAKQRSTVLILAEKSIESVHLFVDQLPPSDYERELLALEVYSRDKRVKSPSFSNTPTGRKDFLKYLSKVRFSAHFGKVISNLTVSNHCPTNDLWLRNFKVVD